GAGEAEGCARGDEEGGQGQGREDREAEGREGREGCQGGEGGQGRAGRRHREGRAGSRAEITASFTPRAGSPIGARRIARSPRRRTQKSGSAAGAGGGRTRTRALRCRREKPSGLSLTSRARRPDSGPLRP